MPQRQKNSPNHPDDIVQVTVTLESRAMRDPAVGDVFDMTSIKVRLRAIEADRYLDEVGDAVRKLTAAAAGKGSWFEGSIKEIQLEAGSRDESP
jgi:hypothetical protein